MEITRKKLISHLSPSSAYVIYSEINTNYCNMGNMSVVLFAELYDLIGASIYFPNILTIQNRHLASPEDHETWY